MARNTNSTKKTASKKTKSFDWNKFWSEQVDAPIVQSAELSLLYTHMLDELPDFTEAPMILDEKFEEFSEEHPESTIGEFAREISGADKSEATEILESAVTLTAEEIALLEEIEKNEAAGPTIIDHHTQIDSWTLVETSVEDEEKPEEPAETEENKPEFAKLIASFDDETVTKMTFRIAAAVDERVSFETAKNPENSSIQSTLKKVRSELVTKCAARVMLATNTTPDFINRQLHDGSRYNVYALGKYADLVRTLADGDSMKNAINNAVTRSLFACRREGFTFTGELARAAASDKIRIEGAVKRLLVRHTVSSSTAPTQASSTMSALQTLGVVKIEGSSRNPTYAITNAPIVDALEKKLSAAA